MLVFDPGALNAFSQPKALVSHASAYVLLGLLTALALYHGRQMVRWSPLHVPAAAYAGAYVLATVFALDQRVALYGAPDRSLGLVSALDSVLVYVAAVALLRTRTDLLWLGSTLGGTTFLVVGYALVQKVGLDPVPWASELVEARPFATTGNPGVLGQYMATVVAGAGALGILMSRLAARVALASAVVAACALVGALLAGARSSLFGVLAGGLVAVVSLAPRLRWRGRVLIVAGSFLSVIVVAAALLAAFGLRGEALSSGAVGEALATAAAGGSVAGRLDIYRVAFEELRERPLLGVGPDNYVVAYPRYRSPEHSSLHESEAPQSSTHSWFWKTATDAGAIGLAAFLAVALTGLAIGIRGMRADPLPGAVSAAAVATLTAYLATGLFSIDHVATQWMPWAALGVVIAGPRAATTAPRGVASTSMRSRRQPRSVAEWRRPLPLSVMVAGVLLAFSVIPAIQASHAAQDTRQELRGSDRARAALLEDARRAVSLDPGRAEYWGLLGQAEFSAGDFVAAAAALSRASEIAPYEAAYLTALARARINLGLRGDDQARADALSVAQRAVEIAPDAASTRYTLALVLLGSGHAAEAAAESERALALRAPMGAEPYEIAGRAYLLTDQPNEALQWIDRGRGFAWSADDTFDLRLLRAEALIALGRIVEAAAEIVAVQAEEPRNAGARQLRGDLLSPADDVLISERFRSEPAWRLVEGDAIGEARRGILTPAPATTSSGATGSWRVLTADLGAAAVRISLQVRMPEPGAGTYFEIGRLVDESDAILLRYDVRAQTIAFVRRANGVDEVIESGILRTIRPGMWHWIQVELGGPALLALVARSGADPGPLAESTLIGVLKAEVPSSPTRGSVMIGTDLSFPPVQLGGVSDAPGGFYVERLDAQ